MNKITLRKRLFALAVCVFAWVGVNAQREGNTLTITPENLTKNTSDFGDLTGVTTLKLVGNFTGWSSGVLMDDSWKSSITSIDLSKANFLATSETINSDDQDNDTRPSTTHSISNSWTLKNFTNVNLAITWPDDNSITVLPDYAFYGCGMQNVTIPSSVVTLGQFAFGTCGNLQSVTFQTPNNVKYLLNSCFKETGLISISIPGSVREIQGMAFQNSGASSPLKSITFEEATNAQGNSIVDMKIAENAFNNNFKILDVYIETLGTITAEADAFPKDITYGQTNPNNPMATLHFPDDKAYLYANLEHELNPDDIANDAAFQVWLNEHNSRATSVNNGFFQFVNNGSSNGTPVEGKVVLRTFSHAKLDYIMPRGAKAFIVTSVSSNDGGKTYKVDLKKVDVIPHGTGVIIYGGTNTKASDGVNNTLSMTAVNYTGNAFTRTSLYQGSPNLLVGTSSTVNDQGVIVPCNSVYITPYETAENGTIAWRNFVLSKFGFSDSGKEYMKTHPDTEDFFGFFRTKRGNISSGKAYLRLTATEFPKSTGGEVIVPQESSSQYGCYDYRKEYKPGESNTILTEDEMRAKLYWYTKTDDSNSKILWEKDWGVRNLDPSFTMAKYSGEPFIDFTEEEGVATLILPSSVVQPETSNEYYTLQGVKVNNPSKGIYIKNGKKIVVK